jgi:DNA repair photolyase
VFKITGQESKPYVIVKGNKGREDITSFRQTANCFSAYEVNPALGCDFSCTYCSMYAQESQLSHKPLRIFAGYPSYLQDFIKENNGKRLIFNFTPKSDAFGPSLIDSGLTEKILDVFAANACSFYIITKAGMPPEHIRKRLVEAKDLGQVIISAGLPDEKYRQVLEPDAPNMQERMDFARFCIENGIECSGIAAPFLPLGSEDYRRELIDRYSGAGISHVSVQLLKLSACCLERLCAQVPEMAEMLSLMYSNNGNQAVAWRLPGGKDVERKYAPTGIIKEELYSLRGFAAGKGITLSICKDVANIIEDPSFNEEAMKKGITCVGFKIRR